MEHITAPGWAALLVETDRLVRVYAQRRMISRRAFFDRIIAGLCAAIYGMAQDQPQPEESLPSPLMLFLPGPNGRVLTTAMAMTPGDVDSIRAVVEAMFKMPRFQMPEVMAAILKQRFIDAQMAYFDGKTPGVTDGAVVDAINSLATAFETPDYGRVSLLQVRYVHARIASQIVPTLFRPIKLDIVGEANAPMSPLEAFYLMAILIEQKFENAAYQVPPAEWDRDVYPRAIAQERAQRELSRRIASGEVPVPPNPHGELRSGRVITARGDLLLTVRQQIVAMSVSDGLKLFNETFARLGIQ